MTIARPIHELKRLNSDLLQVLSDNHTFLRSTLLQTVDTAEIGFFIGLHPSLTNIEWRTHQLRLALGNPETLPKFHLYRRQLQENNTKTSCIVLRCAKPEAHILQQKLMEAHPHSLGKNVEFIPYQLSSLWEQHEYVQLFLQQNQYITDVGAVAIQNITSQTMENIQEEEQITLQQYLLSNSQILSIEKSDTPQVNKWWILTKKTDLQKVTEFLNTDMVHYMSFVNPIQRPYTPPNQITTNRIMAPETDKNVTKFSQRLKNRLQQRPKLNQIIQTPP